MFKGEFCPLFTCYLRLCNVLRHYGAVQKKKNHTNHTAKLYFQRNTLNGHENLVLKNINFVKKK